MVKKVLIIFIICFIITFFINYFFFTKSSETTVLNKVSNTPKETTVSTIKTTSSAKNKDELLNKIKNLVFETNSDIDFGITVYDLKNDTHYGYNDERTYHAASVPKILTAIYLLKKVQNNEIKLSDDLGAFTVEYNLKQMVNQSNTEAWEMIDDLVGIGPQQEFADSLNLKSVNFNKNLVSPQDAALLFVKLWKGDILEDRYQKRLLSFMQNTETENLITPAIPKEIPLYHKSGLFEGQVYDVAIIDHPTKPFIISIFTVNKILPDYEGRAQLIKKIAAEVYSFHTQ